MESNNKTIIYGFDLLKFLMAAMVVSIHTSAFVEHSIVQMFMQILVGPSVPVFFILSSFFVFKKINNGGGWDTVKSFIRRLLILYLFWLIVDLPLIVYVKYDYISLGVKSLLFQVIKDFCFGNTFGGSWFLTSLAFSVLYVYIFNNCLKIPKIIVVLVAFASYLYFELNFILPESLNVFYDFIKTNINKNVELTPVRGLLWCSIGSCLCNERFFQIFLNSKKRTVLLAVSFVFFSTLLILGVFNLAGVWKIFLTIIVVTIFYIIPVSPSQIYKKLRDCSILIFFSHRWVITILRAVHINSQLLGNLFFYAVVLCLSLIASLAILKLEKTKYFKVFRYSH